MSVYSQRIVFNIIFSTIVLLLSPNLSKAAGDEELAKKLFKDENYIEALNHYEQLYNLYPNDTKIQYALGVCMVETNNFTQKAKKLLLRASIQGAEPKVNFYIGKIYHALNNFETAKDYYTRFEESAKKKDLKAVKFDSVKQDCLNKINPFKDQPIEIQAQESQIAEPQEATPVVSENQTETLPQKENVDVVPTVAEHKEQEDENKVIVEQDTVKSIHPKLIAEQEVATRPLNANDEDTVTAEAVQTNTPTLVDTALIVTQEKAVEPINETNEQEENVVETRHETVSVNEPSSIPEELKDTLFSFFLTSEIEYIQIDQFKTETGKDLFLKGWDKNMQMELTLATIGNLRKEYSKTEDDKRKGAIAKQVLDLELSIPGIKNERDMSYMKSREQELKSWKNANAQEIEALKDHNKQLKESFFVPEIENNTLTELEAEKDELQDSIKTATNDTIQTTEITEPIKVVEANTDNLIFKIQIGAYSKGLPEYIDRLYKKLAVLRQIDHYTDDRGVVVYTIGELSDFDAALKLQKQIRQEGVKDAFVVAYNNGKRITLKEAREILKK